MVEASETLTTEKSIKLFEKFGIFTKAELESREEVLYETYSKTINIEALTMVDMAKKQYIPAVMEYTRTLADTVLAVKSAGADATVQTTVLKSISEKLAEAQAAETALWRISWLRQQVSRIPRSLLYSIKMWYIPQWMT